MTPGSALGDGDRLHRIETVTDTALAHLGVEELLVELLDRVRELLQADTAAVLLLDPSSGQLVATAARGLEEEVRQNVRLPMGQGFAGRVAAEKRPVAIERLEDAEVLSPLLRAKGLTSLLGVPMLTNGSVLGVLHVGTLHPRRFAGDDIELLQLVADRIALATQAHNSELDRAAAKALQRSLLPTVLPAVPGIDMAARYIAGEEGGVSGDWYDVFTLPSGRLYIAIGDVIGRGLRAAVVMGRLRSALRAYALESEDPAEVLGKLSRKVQHFEPDMMATVMYAVFEPSLERLHVSLAGHPPPVLALPGQPAVLLDVPADPPVGVQPVQPRRTTIVDLAPGAVLCFYTDGLIERRGSSIDAGLELLCGSVVAGRSDSVCATVMAKLLGEDSPDDDIALLTVHRHETALSPPPPPPPPPRPARP